MYYTVHHVTRFRYSTPISESSMEVRIQPRTEGIQRCLDFHLHTSPRTRILTYKGELGNRVHHFDIPNRHSQLLITAEALVEVTPAPTLPQSLRPQAWDELDALTATDEYWDMLMPSHFASPSPLLQDFAREINLHRRTDPLTVLRDLNTSIYESFAYSQEYTQVDSPIDDALSERRGVCQDFAHIMITLVRQLRIPCRYVSGYLYQRGGVRERSVESATHAWVEALLPELGWVGFDPTNNTLTAERHIRVAIGRDYADVPPTRGVFRGKARTELSVAVKVLASDATPTIDLSPPEADWLPTNLEAYEPELGPQQQQPQQQQQSYLISTDLQNFADEDFCYLTTKGRVSGRPHTIEIWFVLNGHTLYMLSGGLDSADWVKNILRQPAVSVKIKDRLFPGQGRIVKNAEEDTLARQLIAQKYPSSDQEDLTDWYRDSLPVAVDLLV